MAADTGKLTALAIKAAKPGKLFDGGGLFLDVRPNGSRYWRVKYRFGGRENLLALGVYPEVSLAEARKGRDTARTLLRQGVDPSADRKAARDAQKRDVDAEFKLVAQAWLDFRKKDWAPETYRKAKYVVDTYLIPKLGRYSITSLSSGQATKALEEIAVDTPTLASKARQYVSGIVSYAIRKELREEGKLLSLRGVVSTRSRGHIPAATDPKEVAARAKAQIVAIAKTYGAKLIISDDGGVRSVAARVGITAMQVDDLDLPDHARQTKLKMVEPKQPN